MKFMDVKENCLFGECLYLRNAFDGLPSFNGKSILTVLSFDALYTVYALHYDAHPTLLDQQTVQSRLRMYEMLSLL